MSKPATRDLFFGCPSKSAPTENVLALGMVSVFLAAMLFAPGVLALTGIADSSVTPLETVSPTLNSASAVTESSLSITFSEPMLSPGVTSALNYSVSGAGAGTLSAHPTGASGSGPYTLSWTTGEMENGAPVIVTVSGVQDRVGNPINPTLNSTSGTGLGSAPQFTALNVSPAQAGAGDSVTIMFTASEFLGEEPTVTVNGHDATFFSGGPDYAYMYTVRSDDPLGAASISITGVDAANNTGSLSDDTALQITEPVLVLPLYAWPAALAVLAAAAAMFRRRRGLAGLLLVAALLASSSALAAPPTVSNVSYNQRANGTTGTRVHIYYDLVAPNGSCAVTPMLSKNGGADGFPYPISTCTGDLMNVTTGNGKHIIWDIRADYPEESIPQARIRITADDALVQHSLAYAAGANGTITGTSPQVVSHGASGTAVTASPSTGYHFVQWSDGKTQNPRTDTNVITNISVTASFAINTYTLTYSAGANGTITGTSPQTVNHGASGTAVTASPSTGYHFVQWSDGKTQNPRTDASVTANVSVTASFAINTYTLTYSAGSNGTITGTSPQTVNHGASGTAVTASPNTGYHFVQWSDGKTQNPRTDASVTANVSVSASFAINTYTLTYSAGSNGTITGTSPQTVNHGASGTAVTASPNTGYHFVQWSDGKTQNPRTDASVTANVSVSASFAINTYTLTYTAGSNGSITGTSPQTVNHGSSGTAVTASPSTGYHFVQWSDGKTQNPRTDTNVTANVSVSASFAINTYTLTYTAGSNGTITGTSPQTVNHGASGTAVTASPSTGYHFVQWSDGKTQNPRTDANVTANVSVTASFASNTLIFTYTAGAHGSITGTSPQTVSYGASGTAVTAVADPNYHFLQWSDGSTQNPRTDTNAVTDISVTATFVNNTFTLTYGAGAHGSISGASPQTVDYGASGTAVTAVADPNYHFVQWSDGSTQNPRTDTNVTATVSVTASFSINTYTLAYTAGAGGTISGVSPQTVSYSASGTAVTAVPNTGYHFVQWSDGLSTASRTDTNVTANLSVAAGFAINTYTLAYTAGAGGTISGTSPQTVNYGASGAAVTAVPNTGYHFVQWSDGLSTASRTDANVAANLSVSASFAVNTYTLTYTPGLHGSISGTSPQTVTHGGSGAMVTAVAGTGYHFAQWSDGVLTASRTDTNVTANLSVTASFAINTFTLTYTAGANGTISGATPQTVNYGASGATVTAVPNTGYHFVQWSDGALTASRTDTNVTANLSVSASFALSPPVVTSLAINSGAATSASRLVALNNTCTGGPTDYMASESASFTGASWTAYSTAPTFTLSGIIGSRTVYFKTRNTAGESNVMIDSIFLPPVTVSVASGAFTMGRSTSGDDMIFGATNEDPRHSVTLGAYQIAKNEASNQQYCDVLNWAKAQGYLYNDAAGTAWSGSGDIYAGDAEGARYLILVFSSADCPIQYANSTFSAKAHSGLPGSAAYSLASHPVVTVTWFGAVAFCNWLSAWQGLTPCYDMDTPEWPLTTAPPESGGYRLPTEAEWERAAAWDGSKHWIYGFTGDTLADNAHANYYNGSDYVNPLGFAEYPYTAPRGWFNGTNVSPNGNVTTVNAVSPAGAYDMCGNVWEWCQDWYLSSYYSGGDMTNPTGPITGADRVLRGGSWTDYFVYCRTATRYFSTPDTTYRDIGFRFVRTP